MILGGVLGPAHSLQGASDDVGAKPTSADLSRSNGPILVLGHVKASLRHGRSLAITLAGGTVLQNIQMQLVDNPLHAR